MRFLLSVLFVFSTMSSALSQRLNVSFQQEIIKQGSLVEAKIGVDGESLQKLQLNKLRGQTIAETLYIHSLTSFMRRSGDNVFEAEAVVVLAKVPESREFTANLEGVQIVVSLGDVQVQSTEPEKGFLFSDFTVPEPLKLFRWIAGLLSLVVLGVGIFVFLRRRRLKNQIIKRKRSLKESLVSANSYEEVLAVWDRKFEFFETFPQIRDAFEEFQKVLFKYQFKRTKSDAEKSEILKSYRDFVNKVQGGLDGI